MNFNIFGQAPTKVWQKFFGGNSIEYFKGVAQNSKGNFVISSTTYSFDGDCSNRTNPYSLHPSDLWLFEIDKNGNYLKEKFQRVSFGNFEESVGGGQILSLKNGTLLLQAYPNYNSSYVISIDENFNLNWINSGLAAGGTFSLYNDYLYFFSSKDFEIGYYNIFLTKLDLNFNLIFSKNYGGSRVEHSDAILFDNSTIHLTSRTESNNSGDVGPNNARQYVPDVWYVKTDLEGNLLSEKSYGIYNSSEYPYGIINHKDGSKLILSTESDYNGFFIGLYKINSLGGIIWKKIIRKNDFTLAKKISQDFDGNYLILGEYSENDVNKSWFFKVDQNGNILWEISFGETDDNDLKDFIIDGNGDYYLFGQTNSRSYINEGFHGNSINNQYDNWVMKLENNSCISQLKYSINNSLMGYNAYKTNGSFDITAKFLGNSHGLFSAKKSILLNPGFEIKPSQNSSIFNIVGCENN